MKNFILKQASVAADAAITTDMLCLIEDAGSKVRTEEGTKVYYSSRLRLNTECYDEAILSISGLTELMQFIDLVGEVIVGVDTLTIYDDYVE